MTYTLADFDFELPENLIAQTPAHPRDRARLLIYDRKTRTITDDYFYNIQKYLPSETTLVVNNSKVEKCRLAFPGVEIFVVETINPTTLKAMVRPGKKFKLGAEFSHDNLTFTVQDIDETGLRTLKLNTPLDDPAFDPYRLTPLPPYIAQDESLSDEYQTVYAKPLGSKAAPTAGLHFTDNLLKEIKKDHQVAEVTLHVGLGTFAPVKTENLSEHHLHTEWYEINKATSDQLNSAKHRTAVGTTSVRVLESAIKNGQYHATTGDTDIFILPGYEFIGTQALITNFHLPKSTLLMLVSAFMGSVDELHRVYNHAIKENYRFYSFGDAMLIM